MPELLSTSPENTFNIGVNWGLQSQKGWVLALSGNLGAGKTQLIKGLAHGLGVSQIVKSPSFVLINIYTGGKLPLFHMDLYRLNSPDEIYTAGLDDYIARQQGVCAIEWAEKWCDLKNYKPKLLRIVEIKVIGQSKRLIVYEDISN